ncbi:hypothetical protein FRC01_007646, partial [Tulasnella sp. 417]
IAEDVGLRFAGESAEEAEDFIQAVNKRAYAAGKHKDNAWIADFAYPFFSRKALRWYDNLDEATQNDWKLLRSAILAEFTGQQPTPSAVPSAAPAVTSASWRYTPAAPPPPALVKMTGRIRVDCEEPNGRGYLAIPKKGGEEERLVIKAYSKGETLSSGTSSYGLITRSSTERGSQWSSTWSVKGDSNLLTSSLQADGRQCDAQFVIDTDTPGNIIHVPADLHQFWAQYNGYALATLHFEPMS